VPFKQSYKPSCVGAKLDSSLKETYVKMVGARDLSRLKDNKLGSKGLKKKTKTACTIKNTMTPSKPKTMIYNFYSKSKNKESELVNCRTGYCFKHSLLIKILSSIWVILFFLKLIMSRLQLCNSNESTKRTRAEQCGITPASVRGVSLTHTE
jgi:hypothetical protein